MKSNPVSSWWFVWLFPLFALLISGWLVYKYLAERGPTIRVSFDDASSIQADKTFVRFRGVNIGKVKKITISDDTREVIAIVQLQRDARNFAVEGSKFWVVSPKVSLKEITGLETFFGGTYIAAQPGKSDADEADEFKGLLMSDNTDAFENTTAYYLETPNAESVTVGDQVSFRGLEVGSVRRLGLVKGSQLVQVQVAIQNHYAKLVRSNSVFTKKAAIQAKLGLFKSEIKINSLDTIMHGGIEFNTPDEPGSVAKAHSRFMLFSGAPKDFEKWNPRLE